MLNIVTVRYKECFKRDLLCLGILRGVEWKLLTDVSRQPIDIILKAQAFQVHLLIFLIIHLINARNMERITVWLVTLPPGAVTVYCASMIAQAADRRHRTFRNVTYGVRHRVATGTRIS